MDEINKKEYEISFLLASPEAEKEFAAVLAKLGAEVFFQKPAAPLALAYKIQRLTSALFGYYHFRATPEVIKQMKDTLNLTPGVLRFLILTPPVKMTMGESDRREMRAAADKKTAAAAPRILSNEALSEKLEEILK